MGPNVPLLMSTYAWSYRYKSDTASEEYGEVMRIAVVLLLVAILLVVTGHLHF